MQDEREKVKQSIKYAVHVHEGGGELNDTQKLENPRARWEQVAAKPQEGAAYVRKKCGKTSKTT